MSALTEANDVLVSSTLRDLVIGSGLEFEDRGMHQLKGLFANESALVVGGDPRSGVVSFR